MKKIFAEFIGTLILVLIGCGSAVGANALFTALGMGLPVAFTSLLIAVAFGTTFIAMYYTLGSISGCHLNPAVSLAMLINKRMTVKEFFGYIVAQFVGAAAGAGLLAIFVQGRTSLDANAYGDSSTFGINLWMALGIEFVMTFIFVLVFLGASDKKEKSNVTGMVIGFALIAVYLFSIPFTGGGANPARSFGPAVIQLSTALLQLWVFVVAPFAGAVVAGFANKALRAEPKAAVAASHVKDPIGAALDSEELEKAEEPEGPQTPEKTEEKAAE